MKNLPIYFLLIITTLPLFGCQKSSKSYTEIDNKSYINDFELLQDNPNNILQDPSPVMEKIEFNQNSI